MGIDNDLEKIALQEKRLQFDSFDAEAAWAIGTALKAAAEKRGAAVAIDIQLHGHPLFAYAMTGTTPDNLDWIRRKRNVVLRYHRSSYAIGLTHQRNQTTLQSKIRARSERLRAARRLLPNYFGGHGMCRHHYSIGPAAARRSRVGSERAPKISEFIRRKSGVRSPVGRFFALWIVWRKRSPRSAPPAAALHEAAKMR